MALLVDPTQHLVKVLKMVITKTQDRDSPVLPNEGQYAMSPGYLLVTQSLLLLYFTDKLYTKA